MTQLKWRTGDPEEPGVYRVLQENSLAGRVVYAVWTGKYWSAIGVAPCTAEGNAVFGSRASHQNRYWLPLED